MTDSQCGMATASNKKTTYAFNSLNDAEILEYIKNSDKISLADIQQSIEDMKAKEILAQHHIWEQDVKNNHYYVVWLLDKEGRRLKQAKRKDKQALEQLIIAHYKKVHAESTVSDLYKEFVEYKAKFVKPNTIQKYQSDWNRYYVTDQEFVNIPFRKVGKKDIDLFLANTVKTHKLNTKAFSSICSLLRQMFIYATDNDYIPDNPFRVKREIKKGCTPTRRKSSEQETYTDKEIRLVCEEMERRLNENPDNTAPLGVMLAFELGVRIGELMAINLDDINEKERTLYIHSQLSASYDMSDIDNIKRNGYEIVDYTKTPQGERIIPLTDRAMNIIERIIMVNERCGYDREGYLFLNEKGIQPPKAVEAQLRSGCRHIGIKYRSPHKMRKSYASSLINHNVPITTVQTLLCHSEPSTTLRYYTFDNSNKSEVYENVKNILKDRFIE